ncbi:MAG: glutamate--tRNA ligase [Kiritimatiellae bacterium]|nr:glutamate--tRNA ligase [Kiritimatiellia bacterium]
MTVRTRFAPSPTGHVHIGNIRAAIHAWLFARHAGGNFLLRIEDTDRERSTPEAVQTVLDAMQWLGLNWDEEPLYQSSRTPAHLEAAESLLSAGRAYKEDKGGTGKGEAIVFRMPGTDMSFHDEIKGDLRKAAADIKDFVIVRSNGTPVFHLANVVDDVHMGITHIIRGDDHIENTYRHVALFQALGATAPKYAHLPMIVNAQGKPYSKRDGAAYVGEFKEKGYLADAMFNYLALLGWSPGGDREVMTRDEMVGLFTLDRVQSSPAQFDLSKLDWMNGVYMRALPQRELLGGCRAAMEARGLWNESVTEDFFAKVVSAMGDRLHFFTDIADQAAFFFTEDYPYDEKAVQKRLKKEGAMDGLGALRQSLAALEPFSGKAAEEALRMLAEERGVGAGTLIHPVRVAVSGISEGPSLFDMLEVLGKERVLRRIDRTVEKFR